MSSTLKELVDNSRTDKNTTHSYLELYQNLLQPRRNRAKNVLEVGIFDGGSIKLWHDFFPQARVYALDIMPRANVWHEICNKYRIEIFADTNAYDPVFFQRKFLDQGIKCDFMLDDGPHTLQSMKDFIRLYSQLLTDDGILIVEDVQDWNWIQELRNVVPTELQSFIKVYDLRQNKGRYDDIVFTIDKQ